MQTPAAIRVSFRSATPADEAGLSALWRDAMSTWSGGEFSDAQLTRSARSGVTERLPRLIREGTILGSVRKQRWITLVGVDLAEGQLVGPFVAPEFQGLGLGRRAVTTAERLAARYQLFRLAVPAFRPTIGFYGACSYTALAGMAPETERVSGLPQQVLRRHFRRRQTRYGRRIATLLNALDLPADYGRRHRLPLQAETSDLVAAGKGIHNRPRKMARATRDAWRAMRASAADDGVTLQLVSAYRSVDYQADIIRRKRERGLSTAEILRVSAAPGFSEHHTGRALDLTAPGAEALETSFENTAAFAWLTAEAKHHGFRLSYPRDNLHGIAYEPWHWFHIG